MRAVLVLLGALWALPLQAQQPCDWPLWQQFHAQYMERGRVVDRSDPRSITTSEGQSYGLFFALLANDQARFAQLLDWTEAELADGDLSAQLPAWLWGRREDGSWGVLDSNAAADSDLWIAYALVEAGRLWQNHRYASLGYLLGRRILREETVQIAGLGKVLLPGPQGFVLSEGRYRLNPSYLPLQLLDLMASRFPSQDWLALRNGSEKLLLAASGAGFMPDWVTVSAASVGADERSGPVGSYDAIRHYLWLGMLAPSHPAKPPLLAAMSGMHEVLLTQPAPPEKVNTRSGAAQGRGPYGFSAALLPFLAALDEAELLQQQMLRAQQGLRDSAEQASYYNQVLSLFGLGWQQQRYRFSASGELLVNWGAACG